MINANFSYMTTSDALKIRIAHWLPPLGRLMGAGRNIAVILQGRASYIEKFDETAQDLAGRGFDVWSLDWRGQGLSSRLIGDHHRGHIDNYDNYLKDLHQLMIEHIRPTSREHVLIMGQSMGAHIGLRYLHDYPDYGTEAILATPMLDIQTGGYPKAAAKWLAKLYCEMGMGEHYVFGHSSYDPRYEPFEGNLLTHDRERYSAHRELQMKNPSLVLGGATFSWLNATFDSIEKTLNADYLKTIDMPVLFVTAGQDYLVDNSILPFVLGQMPGAVHHHYEDSRHQIFLESDDVRGSLWGDLDGFLKGALVQNNGIRGDLVSPERRFVKPAQLSGMQSQDAIA